MSCNGQLPFFKPFSEEDKKEELEQRVPEKVELSDVEKKNLYRSRFTRRQRLRFWLFDRMGLVPVEDFDDLISMLDELGVIVYKNMKIMTKFHKTQADFDIRVAERLHMDKILDDGNDDRGVYQ